MLKIDIEKTLNLINELNNDNWIIECTHCYKKFKPKRSLNSLILECPECEYCIQITAVET